MEFRGRYYFLSNMYPCTVKFGNHTYKCAEAAFQAQKCLDEDIQEVFENLNGFAAKKLGREVVLRDDWDKVKDHVMQLVVTAKFKQHPDLLLRLRRVDEHIQEDNTWHDTYWGVCNGKGENKLGKILNNVKVLL